MTPNRWDTPASQTSPRPIPAAAQAPPLAFPKILAAHGAYAPDAGRTFAVRPRQPFRSSAATDRAGLPPRRWPRWLATAAALGGLGCAWVAFSDHDQAPRDLVDAADRMIAAHGFGIAQISLEGHRYTPDGDIFDALGVTPQTSMLSFNGTEAAGRILRLPWIARVQIKPQVPSGLHIVVTERTPFAVWETDASPNATQRRRLIDQSGHVLTSIGPEAFTHLPLLRGEGAQAAAADLLATLSLFPDLAARLKSAERVGQRRWSLELGAGLRVHLPAEQEAAALQRLAALHAHHGLLDRALAEIDLRDAALMVRPARAPGDGPVGARQVAAHSPNL